MGPSARGAALGHVTAAVADLDAPLKAQDKAVCAAFCALVDHCLGPAVVRPGWP